MSFGSTSLVPRPSRGWLRPRCGRHRRPRPLSELDAVMNRLPAPCRLTALPAHARAKTRKLGAGSFDATTWSLLPVGCPPLTGAPVGIPDRLRGHFLASGPAAHARTEYVPDRQWAVIDQRDVGFCWGRHALLGSDGD